MGMFNVFENEKQESTAENEQWGDYGGSVFGAPDLRANGNKAAVTLFQAPTRGIEPVYFFSAAAVVAVAFLWKGKK